MSDGGYRRNDNFGPKPVETGKEYDVQITEISRKGEGIARIQGFVIFVKEGKVGQNAKIRICTSRQQIRHRRNYRRSAKREHCWRSNRLGVVN